MEIKIGLAGSSTFAQEIKKGISHILVCKTGGGLISAENIGLTLNLKSNATQVLIPTTKLRTCAVISQYFEGYQLESKTGSSAYKSAYLIRLTPTGAALALNDDSYLTLKLDTLSTSGATYDIYGMESPYATKVALKQWQKTLDGADPQNFQFDAVQNAKATYISNNGGLESIRVSYSNGGNEVTFTPPELSAMLRAKNDMSFMPDNLSTDNSGNVQTLSGGGVDLFYISMEGVKSFVVNTVGGIDVQVIQQQIFGY